MRYLLIVVVAVLLIGCTLNHGSFSMVTTKKIDITKTYVRGSEKVTGKDAIEIYVIFPTGWHPDASEAVNDALRNSCAEYLTDAELTMKHWFIPYIYGKTWWEITGYPWYLENNDRQNCLKNKGTSLAQVTQ